MFPNQFVKPNLFSKSLSAAKGINWSSLLDGTQKTLGIINQAIPIVYQVKPILTNAKTMFKIADVMKQPDTSFNDVQISNTKVNVENKPIFYI